MSDLEIKLEIAKLCTFRSEAGSYVVFKSEDYEKIVAAVLGTKTITVSLDGVEVARATMPKP